MYDVQVSSEAAHKTPLGIENDTTLPDCVKQTGMMTKAVASLGQ